MVSAVCTVLLWGSPETFPLVGHLQMAPGVAYGKPKAFIRLTGVTRPFVAVTWSNPSNGTFRFEDLPAGSYQASIDFPGKGRLFATLVVVEGLANKLGEVHQTVSVDLERLTPLDEKMQISLASLKVASGARKAHKKAQRKLARRDLAGAVQLLQKAIKLEPNYTEALNQLGVILYQEKRFSEAAQHFRLAHRSDQTAYAPVVNLGGVLLNLGHLEEALETNQDAFGREPDDPLCNAQLGLNYFLLGQEDLAIQHLERTKSLDPRHFTHPQLVLAKIFTRRKQKDRALEEIESLLEVNPGVQEARQLRDTLTSGP